MASSVARFIALIWVVLNPVFQVFQERDRQKSVSVACDLCIIFIFTSFLAVPVLSCGTRNLHCIIAGLYHSDSLLWHVTSSSSSRY